MVNFVSLKPLSINEAWVGKLRKTKKHQTYLYNLAFLLPNNYKIPEPPYEVYFIWGFSSSASDWDNPIKPFQDSLAKKYGFNDKLIMKATVEKKVVKRGQEYIGFKIMHYETE